MTEREAKSLPIVPQAVRCPECGITFEVDCASPRMAVGSDVQVVNCPKCGTPVDHSFPGHVIRVVPD